jgi:hypothetical protein
MMMLMSAWAAPAAPAARSPRVSSTFALYRIAAAQGTIQVSFRGDPAACAAGRCGVSGTETYTVAPPTSKADLGVLFLLTAGGQSHSQGEVLLGNGTATASVSQGSGGPPCTDQQLGLALALGLQSASNNSVAVVFAPPGLSPGSSTTPANLTFGGADIFDTRCAGPRIGDLINASALPSAALPATTWLRPTVTVDLNSNKPLAAGGFLGSVATGLHLQLQRIRLPKGASKGPSGVLK